MAPAERVTHFYEAFARRDAVAMAACYHPQATFEDPAFGVLDRAAACAMWTMLLQRSTDLAVSHQVVSEHGGQVLARWEARYTFSRTGRTVVNHIEATFTFQDGLILNHRDQFSFWAWARQAFGPLGLMLGWTPWFHRRFQGEAQRTLKAFRAKEAAR